MSKITIDNSNTLGDVVIRISHAELARLTLAMYQQRLGTRLDMSTNEPELFADGIVERFEEVNEQTGFTAVEGFLASLGCDYLVWDTDISGRVEAHLAAEAEVSNVVTIRADIYSDEATEALLAASVDAWCAEAEAASEQAA